MKTDNHFYIFKKGTSTIVPGYTYDLVTGEIREEATTCGILKHDITGYKKIIVNTGLIMPQITVYKWATSSFIGFEVIQVDTSKECVLEYNVPTGVKQVAFIFATQITASEAVDSLNGIEVYPHYKQLKKIYKKESGQMLFRESLDGNLTLFNTGYDLVDSASINDMLYLYLYKGSNLYIKACFNKIDCKFNHAKKSVELKLQYLDRYSKIINNYDNTYDLFTIAPANTPLTLTKRSILQLYNQGESVISSYAGGTYWETEVEPVDDPTELQDTYHFARNTIIKEISLAGANTNINGIYAINGNSPIWNILADATSVQQGSIVFRKIYNANEQIGDIENPYEGPDIYKLSTGGGNGTYHEDDDANLPLYCTYDTYVIEIWSQKNGGGSLIYTSEKLYGKDTVHFDLASGTLYSMVRTQTSYTPSQFYLGLRVITYTIWGRLLCDIDSFQSGQTTVNTYELGYDDFAAPRRNYKRCIGWSINDPNILTILQTANASTEPTAYGQNDFGEYFLPPEHSNEQYFFPFSKKSWVNTSLWVRFGNNNSSLAFEAVLESFYKNYTLKNAYHIGDVIKALLQQIDPSITHEKTMAYSEFLYVHAGGSALFLNNCDLYITPKSNILKGEYDEAAKKAEITLKQIMEMLRDCYRCYWFIDDQNRFRIEHISFFQNGFTYDPEEEPLALAAYVDKFNKKPILYGQEEITFDKTDLNSRYEFAWMDNTTKAAGGDLYVNVTNEYVQKDKKENIQLSKFTADIDYMLFLPDDFSNDGFALLQANSNRRVPIERVQLKDERQNNTAIDMYIQNYWASFNNLINHYMYDISGDSLQYNNVNYLYPVSIKRCMKHSISFLINNMFNIDIYKSVSTPLGIGYIDNAAIDIDTNLIQLDLLYELH